MTPLLWLALAATAIELPDEFDDLREEAEETALVETDSKAHLEAQLAAQVAAVAETHAAIAALRAQAAAPSWHPKIPTDCVREHTFVDFTKSFGMTAGGLHLMVHQWDQREGIPLGEDGVLQLAVKSPLLPHFHLVLWKGIPTWTNGKWTGEEVAHYHGSDCSLTMPDLNLCGTLTSCTYATCTITPNHAKTADLKRPDATVAWGIGFSTAGGLRVASVTPDSPVKDILLPGAEILKVNEHKKSPQEMVDMLKDDTTVEVTYLPPDAKQQGTWTLPGGNHAKWVARGPKKKEDPAARYSVTFRDKGGVDVCSQIKSFEVREADYFELSGGRTNVLGHFNVMSGLGQDGQ